MAVILEGCFEKRVNKVELEKNEAQDEEPFDVVIFLSQKFTSNSYSLVINEIPITENQPHFVLTTPKCVTIIISCCVKY